MDQDKLEADARKIGGECRSKVPAAPAGQTGGWVVAGAAGQDPRIIMDCCGDSDLIKGVLFPGAERMKISPWVQCW